jgi:uncharacterized heparinase superfamily protein
MSKIALLFHTIRYLKIKQIYFRGKYFINRKLQVNTHISTPKHIHPGSENIVLQPSLHNNKSFLGNKTFSFLNLEKSFVNGVDWNYPNYGKLWTYNLNYFEYLNQEEISKKDGLLLIDDFIQNIPNNVVGMEPYPTSLRCINWIRFFVSNKIKNAKYDEILWEQLKLLSKNIEYHLLGNHLLENGFALLFGAYYFNNLHLYHRAKKIVVKELEEQILQDGAHFELSPMYHSVMLYRLLDCYNLVQLNDLFNKELLPLLKEKAENMLSWLERITYENGNFPLLNDAAYKISPTPYELFNYATSLNLAPNKDLKLDESGYRKFESTDFELILDCGSIGPSYQPGHAHADTLSFELYIRNRPVIVDTGTSTYEMNDIRFYERSTNAHNTVTIDNLNSSQVWASHRVGKRAKVKLIKDDSNELIASHDGFLKQGKALHTRHIKIAENEIWIKDDIQEMNGIAHFHFAPNEEIEINDNRVIGRDFVFHFNNFIAINAEESHYSPEFNKRIKNTDVQILFENILETRIIIR